MFLQQTKYNKKNTQQKQHYNRIWYWRGCAHQSRKVQWILITTISRIHMKLIFFISALSSPLPPPLLRMLTKWWYWLVSTPASHHTTPYRCDSWNVTNSEHIYSHSVLTQLSRDFSHPIVLYICIMIGVQLHIPYSKKHIIYTHFVNLIKIEHFSCSLLFVRSFAHYFTNLLKSCSQFRWWSRIIIIFHLVF